MTNRARRLINNLLPKPGLRLTNAVDRGVGALVVDTNTTTEDTKDLTDLVLVNRTLANARLAVEIDPTTWAAIVSTIIITNNEIDVKGVDDDVNPDAIEHLKSKLREWKLDQKIDEILYKSLVDGTCFIRKLFDNNTIKSVELLAYDQNAYDFIEINNQKTGAVDGYMQKAMIYEYPENWDTQSFDSLVEIQGTYEEFPFKPDQIINPKLFPIDKIGQSFVFKVLDYVYIKKEIENSIPDAVRRAAITMGLEVGNDKAPFQPFDAGDSYDTKKAKSQSAIEDVGGNLADREKNGIFAHAFGLKPYLIGNGQIPDYPSILSYLKQEIRTVLLTPDSRFDSASSNRAVAQEQLSGAMGQVTVISYFRDFVCQYLEPLLFDHELRLAGYESEIGRIGLQFKELEVEDELVMAQIAEKAFSLGADPDALLNTYYPRFEHKGDAQSMLDDFQEDDSMSLVPEVNPDNQEGITDENPRLLNSIQATRHLLKSEGLIK